MKNSVVLSFLLFCLISQGQTNDQEVKRMIKREEAIAAELKELSPPKQIRFIREMIADDVRLIVLAQEKIDKKETVIACLNEHFPQHNHRYNKEYWLRELERFNQDQLESFSPQSVLGSCFEELDSFFVQAPRRWFNQIDKNSRLALLSRIALEEKMSLNLEEIVLVESGININILAARDLVGSSYSNLNWLNRQRMAREFRLFKEDYYFRLDLFDRLSGQGYINLYHLEMTGTRLDDLWVARLLTIAYLEEFSEPNRNQKGDSERIEGIKQGLEMLIEIYSVRMNSDFAFHDFEWGLLILRSNIDEYRSPGELDRMRRSIRRKTGVEINLE